LRKVRTFYQDTQHHVTLSSQYRSCTLYRDTTEGYTLQDIEVTASPRRDVLLGRDVLNHFILTLNGKDLTFDLKDP
jgi:hypothetical protein